MANNKLSQHVYGGYFTAQLREMNMEHLAGIPEANGRVVYGEEFDRAYLIMSMIGSGPKVLRNNRTYPIIGAPLADSDVRHEFDKIETTNTTISDDEIEGSPFDKAGVVTVMHRDILKSESIEQMTYRLAPPKHASTAPLLNTSGSAGQHGKYKKLTMQDIKKAALLANRQRWPKDRVLVLSPEHVYDIWGEDQVFKDQFHLIMSGKILDLYGFKISMYTNLPTYKGLGGSYKKQDVGTRPSEVVPAPAQRLRHSSIFYCPSQMIQKKSAVKVYYSPAQSAAGMRHSAFGLRTFVLASPRIPFETTPPTLASHCAGAFVATDL